MKHLTLLLSYLKEDERGATGIIPPGLLCLRLLSLEFMLSFTHHKTWE